MRTLSNANIKEDIADEMQCQDLDFEALAIKAGLSVGELSALLAPAHDLTLVEIHILLSALNCDIRFEVVPG